MASVAHAVETIKETLVYLRYNIVYLEHLLTYAGSSMRAAVRKRERVRLMTRYKMLTGLVTGQKSRYDALEGMVSWWRVPLYALQRFVC
jgi:hypothetical protein